MNIYAHVSKKSQEVAVQKFKKFMENLIRCEYDFEYG